MWRQSGGQSPASNPFQPPPFWCGGRAGGSLQPPTHFNHLRPDVEAERGAVSSLQPISTTSILVRRQSGGESPASNPFQPPPFWCGGRAGGAVSSLQPIQPPPF